MTKTDKSPAGMVQTGWMVNALQGPMVWPMDDDALQLHLTDAYRYCAEGAQPVPLFARKADIDKHDKEQGHG